MTPNAKKTRREPLSREKIVEKAVALLDAEGLDALSMRRLGIALGVEAMALYHHFPNKDAILDAVATRIVEETTPEEFQPTGDWKDLMASGPAAAARALDAHPKAGWLFLGRQYKTAEGLTMLEAPLRILHEAGFRDQELVDAAHAIFAYIAGWYLLTSGQGGTWGSPTDEAVSGASDVVPLAAEYAPMLRDWSGGFNEGLMALLEGLDERRKRAGSAG